MKNNKKDEHESPEEFLERHEIRNLKIARIRRSGQEDRIVRISDLMESYAAQRVSEGRKQNSAF